MFEMHLKIMEHSGAKHTT